MKKTAAILSLAIMFSCGTKESEKNTAGPVKDTAAGASADTAGATTETEGHRKYDIKSGIVSYEIKMEMAGVVTKSKRVLYFDDYGVKECEEEYKIDGTGAETLDKRDFVKDGQRYICSVGSKDGLKTKGSGYGVAAPFNMDEASTMKDNKFKKLNDETICGKTCNSFSMETPSGLITMYGRNHIVYKTTLDNPSMKMKSETVATDVKENVEIPAEKFEVPKGVVLQNM
ncbi:MAG: hypothetical protein H0W61_00985 [Bacteroidetes bacterium]|nr:hypothetical protein [Bacteroidota bacterium]